MEAKDEHERNEEGKLSRDIIIFTPELLALRALIDHIGESDGEK